MNREEVARIIGSIDGKYIAEAGQFPSEARRKAHDPDRKAAGKRPHRLRWAAAACLAVVLVLGSAAVVYAADVREYRAAEAFFAENGLSPEGLSRSEMKAVFRDITTRRFAYSKTPEVIRQVVPGWELRQEEPTPEELAAIWDRKEPAESAPQRGISFRRDFRYIHTEARGEVLESCLLECLRDGEPIWTAEFADFYLDDYAHFPEGTMVWGWNETFSSADRTYAWLAFVDEVGNTVWQQPLNHGFQTEYIAAVLRNDDGTWAVISRGDLRYLCLSIVDAGGRELSFNKTEVGNMGIWNAARLGEGYLVQLGSFNTGDYAHLYRMDRAGNVIDDFAYEGEDCVYHLTDMAEFGGQIYLSAYAVPEQTDEGGRDEIAHILDAVTERGWDISEEELTPLVRDNYTAVLLLCDPEGGAPKTFYSVSGSLGGRLSAEGTDRLDWDVESVARAYFSPATSAFSVGGSCSVFRYSFDAEGSLIGRTDTGETVPYYR